MSVNELLNQVKAAYEVEGGNHWLVDKHSGPWFWWFFTSYLVRSLTHWWWNFFQSQLVHFLLGVILENHSKIRDSYVFKRGFPGPVLKLEVLGEDYAATKRQEQVSSFYVEVTLTSFEMFNLLASITRILSRQKQESFWTSASLNLQCQYFKEGPKRWVSSILHVMISHSRDHNHVSHIVIIFVFRNMLCFCIRNFSSKLRFHVVL